VAEAAQQEMKLRYLAVLEEVHKERTTTADVQVGHVLLARCSSSGRSSSSSSTVLPQGCFLHAAIGHSAAQVTRPLTHAARHAWLPACSMSWQTHRQTWKTQLRRWRHCGRSWNSQTKRVSDRRCATAATGLPTLRPLCGCAGSPLCIILSFPVNPTAQGCGCPPLLV
jgi:hypothetical protein